MTEGQELELCRSRSNDFPCNVCYCQTSTSPYNSPTTKENTCTATNTNPNHTQLSTYPQDRHNRTQKRRRRKKKRKQQGGKTTKKKKRMEWWEDCGWVGWPRCRLLSREHPKQGMLSIQMPIFTPQKHRACHHTDPPVCNCHGIVSVMHGYASAPRFHVKSRLLLPGAVTCAGLPWATRFVRGRGGILVSREGWVGDFGGGMG